MRANYFTLANCLFCLSFGHALAQNDSLAQQTPTFYFKGYVKDLSIVNQTRVPTRKTYFANQIHNRLNFKYTPNEHLTARLEVRNRIIVGNLVSHTPGFAQYMDYENGWVDLSWIGVNEKQIVSHTIVDRLQVSGHFKKVDITVGRQRINWGMNLVWNPNDIFNVYNFLDFDYEERSGSDAARLQIRTGNFSGFDIAVKRGHTKDDIVAAGLVKFNKMGYDFQVLTGVYYTDWVTGLGWAGNILNTGFKTEISYFYPRQNQPGSLDALSLSSSIDYSFNKGWYINLSYLYNSSGHSTPTSFTSISINTISAKSLLPFRHAVFFQTSKTFNPLVMGSLSCIYSPSGNSLILFPTLGYSVGTNLELSLISQSFFGNTSGKYESQGNSYFFRLKWSFGIER